MTKLYEALGGRKFIFMLILLAIGLTVDMYTARGLSETFKELMIFLAAIYVTGNGVSKITNSVKEGMKAKAKSDKVPKDLEKNVTALVQYNDAILNSAQLTNQGVSEIIKKLAEKR